MGVGFWGLCFGGWVFWGWGDGWMDEGSKETELRFLGRGGGGSRFWRDVDG